MDRAFRRAMTLAGNGKGKNAKSGRARVAETRLRALLNRVPARRKSRRTQKGENVDTSPANVMRVGLLRKLLTFTLEHDCEGAAQQWEVWRMCQKPRCRRARACRGNARRCRTMYVEWSEALALKESQANVSEVRRALMARLGVSSG